MNTREIVSLQFGHYSNFIGTHWWNIQETGFDYTGDTPSEINHDVLFRQGLTNKGEVTYTPRLLLVDLKGSLKTLPERGDLYETVTAPTVSSVPWPENAVEVITEEKPPRNEFQEALATPETSNLNSVDSDCLDAKVNVWSDFLYSRFHPRTVNVIRDYQHESASVPFDVYPLGTNLWKEAQFCDDFCDKIRSYIEECDSPQGFQVTVDAVNAFGGLATSCLEYIKDEYDRKSVLTFAAIPSFYSDYNYSNGDEREESTKKDSLRLLNLALTLEALSEHSSLTIPVCTGSKGWRQPGPARKFNHVVYNSDLPYHTSAILASALDTVTMPYRLKSSGFTVGDFCRDLSGYGRKISAASLCLPFGMNAGADLIDCLDNWDGPLWQSITPNCTMGSDKLMQIVTARGIPETRLKRPPEIATRQREMPAYRCNSIREMLTFYLSCTCYASASHVTTLSKPLPIRTPYPRIFDEYVGVTGDILNVPRTKTEDIKNIPVIAACHAGSGVGDMLETLHREAGRIKLGRFHQFRSAGFELDEYNESLSRLLDLRECYEESFE